MLLAAYIYARHILACLWILLVELRHEKTRFTYVKTKDADQLRGNREADQRLCFRYIGSTIPLLS